MTTTAALQIPVKSIVVPADRLRKYRPEHAKSVLAPHMAMYGQDTPIRLRDLGSGRYRLIAGLHRLRAAEHLKWETIAATSAPDAGDPELNEHADTMSEIDENLVRAELSPIEVREHTVERVRRVELLEARRRFLAAEKVLADRCATALAKKVARKDITRTEAKARTAMTAESASTAPVGTFAKARAAMTAESASTAPVGTRSNPTPARQTVGQFHGKVAALAEIGAVLKSSDRTMSRIAREGNALVLLKTKYGVDTKAVIGTRLDQGKQLAALAKVLEDGSAHEIEAVVRTIKSGDPVDVPRYLTRRANEARKASQEMREHPLSVQAKKLGTTGYDLGTRLRDARHAASTPSYRANVEYQRRLKAWAKIEDEIFLEAQRTKEFARMLRDDPVVTPLGDETM